VVKLDTMFENARNPPLPPLPLLPLCLILNTLLILHVTEARRQTGSARICKERVF
jgi:hypothetical protein